MSTKGKSVFLKTIASGMLLLLLASGCSLSPEEEQALKPPLVKPVKENFETYDVKRGTIVKQLNATAVVTSSSSENLFYKESGGRLASIDVKLGDTVLLGQVVATLERGDLESRIRLQQLTLEKAKIALEQTKQDQLGNVNAIRLKMIDVESAQIQMDQLQAQLERTKLVSPLAGVITYLDASKPGDTITAYKTLVTVADPTQVQLVYENSNTTELSGIHVGMEARIKMPNGEVKGKVLQTPATAAYTDNKTQADRNARTIIFGGVDNLTQQAKIGASIGVIVETDRADNVIVIPRLALRSYLGRDYVQILEGESRKEIDVERGLQGSTEIEIRKGLKEGQKVILGN
ncbi:efflux RND transporter periplasmic adaptor subunit [Paenibacillus koleovorans]|uniref:efflux RND transporter periplasmic adaptor subunit n=1 Tax=Paenibacillus koleovorans TaxID=121608 RepID=UPI001FE6175E|nr:efflux RND transporter periplasmic adaptor subunit [Paenibacillus koleovorans]